MYQIITLFILNLHTLSTNCISVNLGGKERCSTSYVIIWWEINQWDTTEHWLEWPKNSVEQELPFIAGGNIKWDKKPRTNTSICICQNLKQPKCPSAGKWTNQHPMEYYLAIIRNELSNHGKTWRKLNGYDWVKEINLKRLYILYDYNDMTL